MNLDVASYYLGNQSYDHHNKDFSMFQMWHYFANIFQW
jgi:hypothetical protein